MTRGPVALAWSRALAWVLGAFFPLVETWRRRHEFGTPRAWPHIFDDYLMGGLLLAAAAASRRADRGRALLAAAWGFACAMMYGSFFGQLTDERAIDASGLPSHCVVAVKGGLLALCVTGLAGALRRPPTATVND